MAKLPKPEPVVTAQVCSVCGEDWAAHPDNPTVVDCVAVLRLRPRLSSTWSGNIGQPTQITYTSTASGSHVERFRTKPKPDDEGEAGVAVPA